MADFWADRPFALHQARKKVFTDMAAEVRAVNTANGWFDSERSPVEGHMLMVTEVAEATEAFRKWGTADATTAPGCTCKGVRHEEACPYDQFTHGKALAKPEGVGSEYADILIRLLDQCDREGIDLVKEYERKVAYNRTRGYRHGGKQL